MGPPEFPAHRETGVFLCRGPSGSQNRTDACILSVPQLHNAANANQKEKYEADFARDQAQIKELERNPKAIEKIARDRKSVV